MAIQGFQILALEWSLISALLFLVLLRFYIRIKVRGTILSWGDFFVLLAWVSFLAQVGMDTELDRLGFFNKDVDALSPDVSKQIGVVTALKIFYVENATYMFCMYMVKGAMLCFYSELIPLHMKKTRLALRITIAFTTVGFAVSTLLNLFLCLPISRNWSLDPSESCLAGWTSAAGSIVPYVFHLASDLMIYCLPIAVLRILRFPRAGVAATFLVGSLCIICAVAVIITGYSTEDLALNWIFCDLEQTWAVCVVCLPSFRVLLKGYAGSSSTTSRLKSSEKFSGGENGTGSVALTHLEAGCGLHDGVNLKYSSNLRETYEMK